MRSIPGEMETVDSMYQLFLPFIKKKKSQQIIFDFSPWKMYVFK